jgi:hypothetical protein
MRNIARALVALLAAISIFFGISFMFNADAALMNAGLEAMGPGGLANARAIIGGAYLTFGVLLIMHTVIHQNMGALRFWIMFLVFSLVGRIVGLISDGSDALSSRSFVPVIVLLVVSGISLMLMMRSEPVSE